MVNITATVHPYQSKCMETAKGKFGSYPTHIIMTVTMAWEGWIVIWNIYSMGPHFK